jgi:TolB-like protein
MTTAPDIFLSYSRDDQARAKLFAEAFTREGFKVWWDVGLRAGEAYDAVTENALSTAKAVVVLWSKRSVESRWVRAEATQADRNKTLMPAMIETCDRPIMFELTQTAELMHWQGDAGDTAFRAFLEDIRRFVVQHGDPVQSAGEDEGKPVGSQGSELTRVVLSAFSLHSAAPGDDQFARNLADEIIYGMSASRTLRVVAAVGNAQAGAPMHAARYSVKGNMGRTPAGIRIGIQILDASSGDVLWAQRFDRETGNPMNVLDELTSTIVSHLDAQLERCEDQRILLAGETLTLEERLRRIHMNLWGWRFEEGLADAEKAVASAPRSARAHAALAAACGSLVSVGIEDDGLRKRAFEHGNRALKIDGQDREVISDVAMAFVHAGDAVRGVGMLERSLEAAPDDARTILSLAIGYLVIGALDQARASLALYRQRRPFSTALPFVNMWETMIHIKTGNLAAAHRVAEEGLRGSVVHAPQLMYHALMCARLGDAVHARESLRKARATGGRRFSLSQVLRSFKVFFRDPELVASLGDELTRLWAEVDALDSR